MCTKMAEELHALFTLYHKSFDLRNMTYTTLWSMVSDAVKRRWCIKLILSTLRLLSIPWISDLKTLLSLQTQLLAWCFPYMYWREEVCSLREFDGQVEV